MSVYDIPVINLFKFIVSYFALNRLNKAISGPGPVIGEILHFIKKSARIIELSQIYGVYNKNK
jgi:hypothetical protein